MRQFDLAGEWQLRRGHDNPMPGHLPGSTYLDNMAAGMEDPFWGMNETAANEMARHEYTYTRTFDLPESFLDAAHVDLVSTGLDTLCTLTLNGSALAQTNNIHRTWRLDAKPLLRQGQNTLAIKIDDPYAYIAARQAQDPLPRMAGNGVAGSSHLRKTPCHFGWDWGPKLPPAGLTGGMELQSYGLRVEDLRIRQQHCDGQVALDVTALLTPLEGPPVSGAITFTSPDGRAAVHVMRAEGDALHCRFVVDDPQLWWCNGMGKQPLYRLDLAVRQGGEVADTQTRQVGLRTIQLDTAPDEYGNQFRFIVNGVPIFVRGANWIPADSFITRVTRQDIDFYVDSARHANMNMLRVWGGGMYESEDFYNACDRNGILVWQDFVFACSAYPLYDLAFLGNVHAEIADNVTRLRHRACLALWCGNNEAEFVSMMWKKGSKVAESNLPFYHNTLRGWVEELDEDTAYWPGSPSGGALAYKPHSMKKGSIRGDSHLWQIWHGMEPIEAFRNYPTRFCSEYGMESMPSMHTVRTFTDAPSPKLFDPVMQLHQKSLGGNEKILYYLLAKYRNPAKFEDYVYLSQLVQANTVRFATDCWRRNIGLQNGALFWQFNDCWPVASWAGIDYGKQLKAVTYHARHFNKLLCLSNDYFGDRAELYVINEYPKPFSGLLEWTLCDFGGQVLSSGTHPVEAPGVSSLRTVVLPFADILKGCKREEAVLLVRLIGENETLDEKSWLLVPDKDAALPCPQLRCECATAEGKATLTLHSDVYARYVYLEADGVTAPWSDNFFDIPAGRSVTVTVQLPQDMGTKQLVERLKIKTLADVEPKNSRLADRLLQFSMLFRKMNFLTWIIFKFI